VNLQTNPDTSLGTDFWRANPHLFVEAHWGPQYCRCCLNEKDDPKHTEAVNPGTHPGNCTGYRVARGTEVGFAPIGWSDNGAACSYQMYDTYQEALAFVVQMRTEYDHWQIDERTYYTAVDTNVTVLA
jgi:hypothetical protein